MSLNDREKRLAKIMLLVDALPQEVISGTIEFRAKTASEQLAYLEETESVFNDTLRMIEETMEGVDAPCLN